MTTLPSTLISRGDLILHLSEHHGDGSPGAHLRVTMRGVAAFHRELASKKYRYMRPGLKTTPWKRSKLESEARYGQLRPFTETPRLSVWRPFGPD
jgi:Glyoxalase superfamily protein